LCKTHWFSPFLGPTEIIWRRRLSQPRTALTVNSPPLSDLICSLRRDVIGEQIRQAVQHVIRVQLAGSSPAIRHQLSRFAPLLPQIGLKLAGLVGSAYYYFTGAGCGRVAGGARYRLRRHSRYCCRR
jgi:hypothetical protein